jgi:hypothetical protein
MMETWRDKGFFSLFFILLFFFCGLIGCQGSSEKKSSTFPWGIGQWVRYETTSNEARAGSKGKSSSPTLIEFSLVGLEKGELKKNRDRKSSATREGLFWLEIYEEFPETSVLLRLLVPEKLKGKPRKILIQNGSGQIVDLTDTENFLEEIWKGMEIVRGIESKEKIDGMKEVINIPAGNFETQSIELEIDNETIQIWTTETIPVWGIAKLSANGINMVLTDFGLTGAVSRMKEGPTVAQTIQGN